MSETNEAAELSDWPDRPQRRLPDAENPLGMSHRMLYLIGPPGVGKTTLMAELTQGQRRLLALEPFAHTVYDQRTAELGYARRSFSGTDALALNVQPRVERWLQQRPYPFLLAEGDRLANSKFFRTVRGAGYELLVVALLGSATAARRRADRGSQQDATWVRGRETKVRNLVRSEEPLILPAELPPDAWAQILAEGGWHPFRREA